MSPRHWREFILPRLRRVVHEFKKRNVLVVLHSDGNITAILNDLAGMGLDGLNPIQARCGVTPKMIKERYPHLTMVGTVDVQYTLPFGSPEEIENEIREIISVAAHGGGLVIGPQHAVQPDVPIENVETIIRAIRKYGQYSLSL